MNSRQDELEKQLQMLNDIEPPPRQEFVMYMGEKLQKEADALKRRLLFLRSLKRVGTAAAVIMLGSWFSWAQMQHSSQSVRPKLEPFSDQDHPKTNRPVDHSPSNDLSRPTIIAPALPAKQETNTQVPNRSASVSDTGKQSQQRERNIHAQLDSRVQLATVHLQKMLGSESQQYTWNRALTDLEGGEIVFSRLINGIPFYDDSYTVGIKNKEISYLRIHSQTAQHTDFSLFPKPSGLISQAKAAEKIASSIRPVYREGNHSEPSLRYELDFPAYLDAKTGEPLTKTGQRVKIQQNKSIIPVTGEGKRLEAASLEETVSLLQSEFGISFDNMEIDSPSQSIGSDSSVTYSWTGNNKTITARIAQNGQFISYHVQNGKTVPDDEHAAGSDPLDIAIRHLKRYLDKSIKELQLAESQQEGSAIRYRFHKAYQGIPVTDHLFEVTVDLAGHVIGLSLELMHADQSPPKAIQAATREAAIADFLKHYKLELIYIWPKETVGKTNAPILVYQVKKQEEK